MADVLPSVANNDFPDTTLLEGAWLQAGDCSERQHVTISQLGVNGSHQGDCVFRLQESTQELFYRNEICNYAGAETNEPLVPTKFKAQCLVALLNAESHRAMFEYMLSVGRDASTPVLFNLTYATTLSPTPNYETASINVAFSILLQDQYGADLVGQVDDHRLAEAEAAMDRKNKQVQLFERTFKGLSPAAVPEPPAGPGIAGFQARLDLLKAEQTQLREELDKLLEEALANQCVSTLEHTCGRTPRAAPNPWVANDDRNCIGKSTFEAMPGYYCARWGSPVRRCASHTPRPCPTHSRFLLCTE